MFSRAITAALLLFAQAGAAQAAQPDDPEPEGGAWIDAEAQTEWEGDDWEDWDEAAAPAWTGYLELAGASRWDHDAAVGRRTTLAEARWRLERTWEGGRGRFDLRADLLADAVLDEVSGELREAAYSFKAGNNDVRLGRQPLTWGTGDLLFLNDLFPKGWVSFFIGRDDEYLKSPGDAIRLTHYTDAVNLDLVALPRFNPDEFLTGERLSFFSPAAGGAVAPDPPLGAAEPSASVSNTEWALRLFRNLGGNELAVYGFRGYYHQPSPAGPGGRLVYPELDALGASWRRTLGPGLFNAEFSRHYSHADRSGTDPTLPNDQARFLLGYEWEAVANLTLGFQYYLERTLDHAALVENSPWPQFEVAENRHWLTHRLSWRTRQDRVIWSLFLFYSPTDDDLYARPQVNWRISDQWLVSVGGNYFRGDDGHTFFAQFEDNSNVYARLRYSY
jgi:hypothetical protein